jgi:GH15 family glucan-1,4-alpha-glucosidase
MPYQPIEDYGVIGNLRTAALVAKTGSIDWFCFPNFDSPSVFGAILDDKKGGHFRISPTSEEISRKQVYGPDTNILITRVLAADGVGEILDYMPLSPSKEVPPFLGLIRRVRVVRGSMQFRLECVPAFNYGRDTHTTEIIAEGARFGSPGLRFGLGSSVPLAQFGDGVSAEFSLDEGQSQSFQFRELSPNENEPIGCSEQLSEELLHDTASYWHQWISKCTYRGRWRETVHRSALALKLLTFQPTGAIVAAPTCSLTRWSRMARFRRCTESTGVTSCPRLRSITGRGIKAPVPSASETPPPSSSSSISTAS